MANRSSGILMYRRTRQSVELLLVHPGGPYWANKDEGAWSIPKGLYEDDEAPKSAALREFEEETGCRVTADLEELGSFRQPSGKTIVAWSAEQDFDIGLFRSNTFSMEWPPKSGRTQEFPEIDKAEWLSPERAMQKILKGQRPIVSALLSRLGISIDGSHMDS
jgi:predicted NUDIX family NTP pyrophosphohydrolase